MTPVVELQQVSGGVLRALDLRAYPGERVGVIAEAGSGKTALAELLVGARQPRRGRVRRDGRDVTRRTRALEPTTAAPGVGWVAQPARPFPRLSVYENVLVAASVRGRSHRLAEGHARRALERLGLEARADRLPAELDGPDAVRLDVARVIAAPRRLVVVDELADRLEPDARRHVADVLGETVVAGAALVWLERPDAAPTGVDRLAVLAYGRIAEEGPPDQVLATPHFRGPTGAREPGASGSSSGHVSDGAITDHPSTADTAAAPDSAAAATGAPRRAGVAMGEPAEGASDGGQGSGEAPGVTSGEPARPARRTGRGRSRRGGGEPAVALAVEGWTTLAAGRGSGASGGPPVSVEPTANPAEVDLRVVLGEVVAVVSPTAAPTSLLLASLAGLVDAKGTLVVGGRDLTGASAAGRSRAGLAFVAREGGVADALTVDEHLALAGARRWRRRWTRSAIYGLFPSLATAGPRPAGSLPALERRCLALARALVTDPQVVLVDEPVRGLPARSGPVVLQALAVVARTAAVVMAERPGGPALAVADRVERLDTRSAAPAAPVGAAR